MKMKMPQNALIFIGGFAAMLGIESNLKRLRLCFEMF